MVHATPCSQCGMRLQPSAPRLIFSPQLKGQSEGGGQSQRKSHTFLHMHAGCAPASLLEAACERYRAQRLADLPGLSGSPNRPFVAQMLSRKLRRFQEEGEQRKRKPRPMRKKKEEIRKASVRAAAESRMDHHAGRPC